LETKILEEEKIEAAAEDELALAIEMLKELTVEQDAAAAKLDEALAKKEEAATKEETAKTVTAAAETKIKKASTK